MLAPDSLLAVLYNYSRASLSILTAAASYHA